MDYRELIKDMAYETYIKKALAMAKEVDDGIFYAKRKHQLAAARIAAQDLGYKPGDLYVPWGLTSKKLEDSPLDSKLRDEYARAEEFRMTKMELPKLAFDSSNLLPSELVFKDHTQKEILAMNGSGIDSKQKKHAYSTGYMPMDVLALSPLYLGRGIQERLLSGLANNDALLLPAPGGFGKSTMWKYFGLMAAQHSLQHLWLWLKEPTLSNVYKEDQYVERRIITFNANKLSVDEGHAGGSDVIYKPLTKLFIEQREKYKDVFILVADEMATALDPAQNKGLKGGGTVGVRAEFEKHFKEYLAPGGENATFKLAMMYAPEDQEHINSSQLGQSSQFARRIITEPLGQMSDGYIETLISRAIFSVGRLQGILESEGGISTSLNSPGFKESYLDTGDFEKLIKAIIVAFKRIKVKLPPNKKTGIVPTIGAPDKVKKVIKAGAAKAKGRMRSFPGIKEDIAKYGELKEMATDFRESLSMQREELARLKNRLPKSTEQETAEGSTRNGLMKKAEEDERVVGVDPFASEEESDSSELLSNEGIENLSISPRDGVEVIDPFREESNATGEGYGEKQIQEEIIKKEKDIEFILTKLKGMAPEFYELEVTMSKIQDKLESDYQGTKFLSDLADIGWLKPIDISSLEDHELIIGAEEALRLSQDDPYIDPGEGVDVDAVKQLNE